MCTELFVPLPDCYRNGTSRTSCWCTPCSERRSTSTAGRIWQRFRPSAAQPTAFAEEFYLASVRSWCGLSYEVLFHGTRRWPLPWDCRPVHCWPNWPTTIWIATISNLWPRTRLVLFVSGGRKGLKEECGLELATACSDWDHHYFSITPF